MGWMNFNEGTEPASSSSTHLLAKVKNKACHLHQGEEEEEDEDEEEEEEDDEDEEKGKEEAPGAVISLLPNPVLWPVRQTECSKTSKTTTSLSPLSLASMPLSQHTASPPSSTSTSK